MTTNKFRFFEYSDSSLQDTKPVPESPSPQSEINDVVTKRDIAARYRCEQFNITKVEDFVKFHYDIKKQYLLDFLANNEARVLLEQYMFKVNPEALTESIAITEDLEYAKENVTFLLNTDNSLKAVKNFDEIKQRWNAFKSTLADANFFKLLMVQNEEAAKGIIAGGDAEFGSQETLLKTYDKTLFYHVIFNDYDPFKDRDQKQLLQFNSQIFLNIPIELELTHGVINENHLSTEIMSVGRLNKAKIDKAALEDQYNKFYKPVIEYGFTDYNYEYTVRRTVDNKTGLIVHATARLMEEVKYNYQFLTEFELKKLNNSSE